MKKQISPLLTLLLLISVNMHSQGFWDKVKKGVKEVGTQIVNNSIPETKTILNMDNIYSHVEIAEDEYGVCGKNYRINISKNQEEIGDNLFTFYEKSPCFQTSKQLKFIEGFYSFLYTIGPDGSILIFREVLPFDESIKAIIKKNGLNDVYCMHYQLIGNDIYLAKFKSKEEMANNKDKKGELTYQINDNNNTINLISDNLTWKYSGKNNQELLIMLTTMAFQTDLTFAEKLDSYYKTVASIQQDEAKTKYLTLKKHCNYCNKEYTGVSFTYSGCDYAFEIYKDASYSYCSRKCAFDYCNQTH